MSWGRPIFGVAWVIGRGVDLNDEGHYFKRDRNSPWEHTSVQRGWPRCPTCRAPMPPNAKKCHRHKSRHRSSMVEPRTRNAEIAVRFRSMAFLVIAMTCLACDPQEIAERLTEPSVEFRYEYLTFDDDLGACNMEVELVNQHPSPCYIGFMAQLTFRDGSHDGFGFVFDRFEPGLDTERYGNTGDVRSGERIYPKTCDEIRSIAPLYSWQSCDDGFRAEEGDHERYLELSSYPTAET